MVTSNNPAVPRVKDDVEDVSGIRARIFAVLMSF